MFALIDPMWGEGPRVITDTIRDTEEEAWTAACDCREVSLYSGWSEFPYPNGTKGTRERLESFGFRVKPIRMEILEPTEASA